LLGALVHFGINHTNADEKDNRRLRVIRGDPWSSEDRAETLRYCGDDALKLEPLLAAMAPGIDLPRALLRGRYMKAAACMEWNGVPIDVETLALLREHWTGIQDELIAAIDADYHCFEGRTFRADWWEQYLIKHGIPWSRLESGRLSLGDDTFRQMAKAYPAVAPMRELRSALSDLRLNDLAVGSDLRNRTIISAFRSRTGRNQPSNTKYIFGPSVWIRSLIKPPPGHGVAYIDWSQQEFGINAVLSGDQAMWEAYTSGDPYLKFAKLAGAVPEDATKETHGPTRELFKQCVLGVGYGMEARSLAARIGKPEIVARDLLRAYRQTFKVACAWTDAAVDHALLHGSIHTVFGWTLHIGADFNPRSLRNFPMQANGAEMLRLACCLGIERGVEVCAPVHDAVLICAPLDRIEHDIAVMRAAMAEASRIVLNGFELRTDVKRIDYPHRFQDPRGERMWRQVMELITKRAGAPAPIIEAA
jgi:DNA polymerase I